VSNVMLVKYTYLQTYKVMNSHVRTRLDCGANEPLLEFGQRKPIALPFGQGRN